MHINGPDGQNQCSSDFAANGREHTRRPVLIFVGLHCQRRRVRESARNLGAG
jgi:hypothetical protein